MSSCGAEGVGIIDEAAGMARLAPEWAALWAACPAASPFQHPAWLLPWWAAFGTGAPRVAVCRAGGRLVGVLPAYVLVEGGAAKLLPVGAGTTDVLAPLGAGAAAMVAALLGRCAAEGVARFDWMDLPEGAGLAEVAVPGWRASWRAGAASPLLALDAVAPGQLRKLRMSRNRAERAGGWAVEDRGAAGFETLVALHQGRWTGDGEPGVLADPAVLRCLRAAVPALAAAGLLRLMELRVGGAPAAAIMALLSPGRIWFYLTGYDAGQAFVSPGTLLLGAMLEQARAEGRHTAHFLRGQEGYKYAWGASDRWNLDGGFVREE